MLRDPSPAIHSHRSITGNGQVFRSRCWPCSWAVYSLVHEDTNIVGATEDISLFQLDCVSFQIVIGCLQIVFLLLMERKIGKSNSWREECSINP